MSVLIFILGMVLIGEGHAFNARICVPNDKNIVVATMDDGLLRLIVSNDGKFNTTHTFHASFGQKKGRKQKEGDKKTPIGVYFISSINTRGDVPEQLSYGAATMPLNYPNPVDERLGRTGHGIWIHGTDDIERLMEVGSSRGCVVLENRNIIKLKELVRVNTTPVVITNNIKEVNLAGASCSDYEIAVSDKGMIYRVTSSGRSEPSILYEFFEHED